MGNLGFGEIAMILVVVLLLFGAKRLPEVGASIGKGIREFKRSLRIPRRLSWATTQRTPPRQVDAPPPANQASGEPKRLSQ